MEPEAEAASPGSCAPERQLRGPMSDGDDEACCPLCMNELDETDEAVEFCRCGYAMCLWCWHRICGEAAKEGAAARCPNCRTIYDLDAIHQRSVTRLDEVKKRKTQQLERRKSALPSVKSRKDLANVRVVQRNLVYVVGLSMDLCYEDVLQSAEHFGQFGKVVKISVSRAGPYGAASAKNKPTGSAYITFRRNEDARRCIETMHNTQWDGKVIKACYGTTKYCNAFLKGVACNNSDCLYLHDVADDEDSYTKEETKSTKFVNLVHAASLSRQASGPPPAPAAPAPGAAPASAAAAAPARPAAAPDAGTSGGGAGTPRAPAAAPERAAAPSSPPPPHDDQAAASPGNGHAWPALGGASWAAKATMGGAAGAPPGGAAPPPAASAVEWPHLPGAGEAGEGAEARPGLPVPPLARSGSTMAAQLARAASAPNGGAPGSARGAPAGVLVVAKGKKLTPLSPAAQPSRLATRPALTPLGPVVAGAGATPALPSARGEPPARPAAPEPAPPPAESGRPRASQAGPPAPAEPAPALSKRKQKLAAKQEAAAAVAAAAAAAAGEDAARRGAAEAAEARLLALGRQREAERAAAAAAAAEQRAGGAGPPAGGGGAAPAAAPEPPPAPRAALAAGDAGAGGQRAAAPPASAPAPPPASDQAAPRARKGPPPGFAAPVPAGATDGSGASAAPSPHLSAGSEASAASAAAAALPETLALTGDALLLPGFGPGPATWDAGAGAERLWLGAPLAEVAAASGLAQRPRARSRFDFAQGCDDKAGDAGGAHAGPAPAPRANGGADAYLQTLFLPGGAAPAPAHGLPPGWGGAGLQPLPASLAPGGRAEDLRGPGLELLRTLQQRPPLAPGPAYLGAAPAAPPPQAGRDAAAPGAWPEPGPAGARAPPAQAAARPGGPPPGFAMGGARARPQAGPMAQLGAGPLPDARWLDEHVRGDVPA